VATPNGNVLSESSAANKKFRKELNSGTVSLVLLGTLARASEPMYGYQIARDLERNTERNTAMKQGALYPVLRSLERGGLLESRVEPSVSGPPRRYYRITAAGRDTLSEWQAIWEETRALVDGVLKGNSNE